MAAMIGKFSQIQGDRVGTTITFDGAAASGTINLGIGQPSADLLPVALLRDASDAFFRQAQPHELNYGPPSGDPRFLSSLAAYLSAAYAAETDADSLFVTGGNSQALDLVSTVFAQPGDTVFVEEPSYFLAFQIFRDHGLNIVGIPLDHDGLDIGYLKNQLQIHRPAFLYTIPSYHNPGGQCLSEVRRQQLLALSIEHDFLIVADEVYQLLSYNHTPPPAFGTLSGQGTVVSMGSFAKILAPGLRLGWIQTSPALRQKLLANGFVNSGGCINHYITHIVRLAIDLGLQAAHLETLRLAYHNRMEAMDKALQQHFTGIAQWTRPAGGYFFWVRCHEHVDTAQLRDRARELQTGFQPGIVFSSVNAFKNYMRLSFAHYTEDDILEGVARIRKLFD